MNIDLTEDQERLLDEAWEGWITVQTIERLSLRDIYEAGFVHGMESAKEAS